MNFFFFQISVYPLVLSFLMCFHLQTVAQDTLQHVVAGRANSVEQQKKPYVILISADGFRYDLAMRYQAKNLLRLSNSGVEATSMQPAFPSLTYPNHYSIVTGMYPSHNGIVANRFYDGKKEKLILWAIKKKCRMEVGMAELRYGCWLSSKKWYHPVFIG
ncbi:MAG: alkaline phosphatase family protein [Ginsengibacter sp.]